MTSLLLVVAALACGAFARIAVSLLSRIHRRVHPVTGVITDLFGTAAACVPFGIAVFVFGNGSLSLYPVAAFILGFIAASILLK